MEAARSSFMRSDISLIAWCLMGNHVHLIIDDPHGRMSEAIHRISSSYASYFNRTFGHTGHVFEGRFGSVAIRDDGQLLAAVRYVHDNPLKGMGISPDRYPWSSYPEYASGASTYTDIDGVLGMLGGTQGFRTFLGATADGGIPSRLSSICRRRRTRSGGARRPRIIRVHSRRREGTSERWRGDRVLKALCDGGLTVRYIQRMTGIGEWAVRAGRRPEASAEPLPSKRGQAPN